MDTPLDHAFAAAISLVFPLYSGLVWFPKISPRLQRNEPGLRRRVYYKAMAEQWALCFGVAALWVCAERPWESLGFPRQLEWPFWAGIGFSALWGFFFWAQYNAVRKSPETRASVKGQIDPKVGAIIPHDKEELPLYYGVSLTAGVCEEILIRGFLMAYLGQWMGQWQAVAVSSVIFGFGHLYQGTANTVKTGTMGLIFGTAYVLSGSLWTPMIMHALLDLFSGLMAHLALTGAGDSEMHPVLKE